MNMARAYVFDALKSESTEILLTCVVLSAKQFEVVFLVFLVH